MRAVGPTPKLRPIPPKSAWNPSATSRDLWPCPACPAIRLSITAPSAHTATAIAASDQNYLDRRADPPAWQLRCAGHVPTTTRPRRPHQGHESNVAHPNPRRAHPENLPRSRFPRMGFPSFRWSVRQGHEQACSDPRLSSQDRSSPPAAGGGCSLRRRIGPAAGHRRRPSERTRNPAHTNRPEFLVGQSLGLWKTRARRVAIPL